MTMQAARGPDGFSSVEAYDKERLKLDAQVGFEATAELLVSGTGDTPATVCSRLQKCQQQG